MISAERLRERIVAMEDLSSGGFAPETLLESMSIARELEAARARIAELEADPLQCANCGCTKADCIASTKPPRNALACCPECQHRLRAQGLSREDRKACLAGAKALIGNGQSMPDYFKDPIAARNERYVAILRRLGAQTT